MTRSICGRSS